MAKPTLFELGDDVRQKLSVFRSGKDANGIYTVVEYKRPDGTLYARSVMNGGTSPNYTTAPMKQNHSESLSQMLRKHPITLGTIFQFFGSILLGYNTKCSRS